MTGQSIAAEALDEVVVTAQKREENLQDVPITITALGREGLSKAGVDSVMDLTFVTPALNFSATTVFAQPYMRGVGTDSFAPGIEASVATYVDGVYISDMASNAFALNNIERIEVLKGPQGTLYGRNSTGGLINIVTRAPTDEFAAESSLSLGNYEAAEFQGYLAGGVSDNVAADVAVYVRNQGEGYYDNLATGNDIVREEGVYIRSKWVATLSDAAELSFSADYQDYTNTLALVRQPAPGTVSAMPAGTWSTIPGNYNMTQDPIGDTKQWGLSARLDWEFDTVKFVSVTALRNSHLDQYIDGDDSSLAIVEVPSADTDHEAFTQEFQLLSNTDSTLQWIAGIFYQNSDSGWDPFHLVIGGSDIFNINIFSETEAAAVFGQFDFDLGDATRLTVGTRYNYEKKDYNSELVPDVTLDKSWNEITGRVALDHRLSDNALIFGSYSRGFKSGAYNTVNVVPHDPVNPEIVDSLEVGFKSDLSDGRVRFNGAVFYTEIQDIQVRAQLPNNAGVTLQNAAEGEILGAEAELQFNVSDDFFVRAGAALTDTEYSDFPNAEIFIPNPPATGGNTAANGNVTGNKMVRTPDWTFNLGGEYTHSLDSGSTIFMSGNLFVTDDIPWDPSNRVTSDGYSVLNAAIGWRSADETWSVELWGKNLTDETYANYFLPSGTDDRISYAQPVTYGIRFGWHAN